MDSFKQQYSSPKWQKKRLDVLKIKGFQCESCGDEDTTLHVHHKIYIKNRKIWEYEDSGFLVLCEECHSSLHNELDQIKRYLGELHPENYISIAYLFYLLQGLNPAEVEESLGLACKIAGDLK